MNAKKSAWLAISLIMGTHCATPPIPLLSVTAPPVYTVIGQRVEGRACFSRGLPSRQAYIEGHYFGIGPDTLDYSLAIQDALQKSTPPADGLLDVDFQHEIFWTIVPQSCVRVSGIPVRLGIQKTEDSVLLTGRNKN